ncbi:hypothetical protein PG984_005401 [Apiospora sp. TS-2023a]
MTTFVHTHLARIPTDPETVRASVAVHPHAGGGRSRIVIVRIGKLDARPGPQRVRGAVDVEVGHIVRPGPEARVERDVVLAPLLFLLLQPAGALAVGAVLLVPDRPVEVRRRLAPAGLPLVFQQALAVELALALRALLLGLQGPVSVRGAFASGAVLLLLHGAVAIQRALAVALDPVVLESPVLFRGASAGGILALALDGQLAIRLAPAPDPVLLVLDGQVAVHSASALHAVPLLADRALSLLDCFGQVRGAFSLDALDGLLLRINLVRALSFGALPLGAVLSGSVLDVLQPLGTLLRRPVLLVADGLGALLVDLVFGTLGCAARARADGRPIEEADTQQGVIVGSVLEIILAGVHLVLETAFGLILIPHGDAAVFVKGTLVGTVLGTGDGGNVVQLFGECEGGALQSKLDRGPGQSQLLSIPRVINTTTDHT